MKNVITYLTVLTSLLAFVVCGGSNLTSTPPPPDPQKVENIINSAWTQYEIGQFELAITLFNEAQVLDNTVLDIFNGLGWSYFQIHNLINSLANFTIAIGSDSSFADAMVGFSVAAFERNEYSLAINAINTIARIDTTGFDIKGTDDYIFNHDKVVNARKVRKILALCYFYSGDFEESFNQLITFLDPATKVDIGSETFISDLLKALEEI